MNRQQRRARAKQITAAGVSIAVCTRGEMASTFVHSLVQFIAWDTAHHHRFLGHGAWSLARVGTGSLPEGRNEHVERFLAGPVEWLMFIDDDMGFEPDAIEHLIEAADPDERPIVGGLCFTHRGNVPGNGIGWTPEVYPTVYDWLDDGERSGFVPRLHVPRDTVIPVAATGAAFLLIHRSVLERMRDRYGPTWFTPTVTPDQRALSEDFSFCVRANAVDVPIYVHTGVVTSHRKEAFLDAQYLAPAFGDQTIPPPATAILIPTYGRADKLAHVVADVHENTPELHHVYVIAESDDTATIEAAEKLDCTLIVNERSPSYAGAINTGVNKTSEPLIFCAADDLHFHPGWLTTAAAQMVGPIRVVGTNDLFNPAVLARQHATHFLVDRRYITDPGGVADQDPGVLLYEGYDHNYCDTEFIATARARLVFRPCLQSIVEHLHPLAGKADQDATYERGFRDYDGDAKRYAAREHLWAA